ncbi:MAG: hypothetical protein AAB089_05735 [Nitrospirota bacterium]
MNTEKFKYKDITDIILIGKNQNSKNWFVIIKNISANQRKSAAE